MQRLFDYLTDTGNLPRINTVESPFAEYLDCPLVTIPGAHNGLRDRPVTAANAVRDVLER